MTLARALQVAAGNSQETGDVAEAIDFDGTNDYLRRTSDLVGNTSSKTFTFSAWIWQASSANGRIYHVSNASTNTRFTVRVVNATLEITGTANTNAVILTLTAELPAVTRTQTFYHVLVSIDMANTANRKIYINDIGEFLTVTTYTNAAIPFNQTSHTIAGADDSADDRGRLSNVFLDYTYRDLSIEANRRLFVTADLKPAAGQAALNPILYLPMDDPTNPGLNAGTGGNFTLTGTVARSGRGPNQYNAPYSTFDGSADYLNRTSITGLADGSSFTVSFSYSPTVQTTDRIIIGNDSQYFNVWFNAGLLRVQGKTSAGATLLLALVTAPTLVVGRNYAITISIDLSSASNRAIYINGESATVTWSTYTNGSIDFTRAFGVGANNSAGDKIQGKLGALWFNTSYIDLSVADNLAKFVTGTGIDAKPVDLGANGELPTGTAPIIYLPMYGNNAGKNYGTGGDFTVNSGPYTGARGPNEFWGNKADFNGTTGYLSRNSALSGISDSKTISGCFWFNSDANIAGTYLLAITNSSYAARVAVLVDSATGNKIRFQCRNAANTIILDVNGNTTLATGTTYCVQFCFDLADTAKRKIYVNGTDQTLSVVTYTNDTINLNVANQSVGAFEYASSTALGFLDGKLSEFYFTTDYIDFTQEANRLKFRDAFGNPVDLTQQIEDGAIPNPAIYMRFPPTAFGTNYGTGGNFTVNGTITDGGQL